MEENKMSKQKDVFDLTGVSPTQMVTRRLTKKGKIKGNKKEVRSLRSICEHHTIKKNGRLKPWVEKIDNGLFRCRICGDVFRMDFYGDQEITKAYKGIKPIASQAKFLTVAVGADKKSRKNVAEFNLRLDNFGKTYKNLRAVADKKAKKDKRKKNKKQSSSWGGWELKR